MGRCPECQNINDDDAQQCSACGAVILNGTADAISAGTDSLATLNELAAVPAGRDSMATLDSLPISNEVLATLQQQEELDQSIDGRTPSPLDTADFDLDTNSQLTLANATLDLAATGDDSSVANHTLDLTEEDPSGTWTIDSVFGKSGSTSANTSKDRSDRIDTNDSAVTMSGGKKPSADEEVGAAEANEENMRTLEGPIGKLATMATLDAMSGNLSSMATLDSSDSHAGYQGTLDSHAPSQDSLATVDSKSAPSSADPYATLDDFDTVDPNKTATPKAAAGQQSNATVQNSGHTVAKPSGSHSARSRKSASANEDYYRTVGSQATSGSAGRLKRMWDGVAGSSQNPMHSLKADSLAVESETKQVAIRKLVEHDQQESESGDYQMLKKLGEGAMGVVYAAKQTAIDRVIALKAIKQGQQNSTDSRRKFLYEAQITGELDHPNIVPIHELGASEDGMLFYSMKLVNGTPWQQAIKSKTLEENVDILMKVADAIAFAHAKNIIHRDLKPENIMLGTFGEVLVMDWGLAVNISSGKSFGLGGTPAYMAPEMAAHHVAKIGATSDVYLLGAILYQIITGIPPHPGKTVNECLRAALKNQIITPSTSHALLDIAMRAMSTEIGERYSSVAQMQDAIKQYRRHAESIALANRSEEMLNQAIKSRDYQSFSRALFGFKDAGELWRENPAANSGIKRCRLAYGQCALDRGDYDLCLEVLDRSNSTENILYVEAESKKIEALGRESRLKSLKKMIAAVVLAALAGVSVLALIAMWQREIAVESERLAIAAKEKETAALISEKQALKVAEQDRDTAVKAKNAESEAKGVAQQERDAAETARTVAEKARQAEVLAKQEVSRKADEIQIGNFQSNLSLAVAQFAQFDTIKGKQSLQAAQLSLESLLLPNKPKFESWASRRAGLLGNIDLAQIQNGAPVRAIAYAPSAGRGALGTADGKIQIFELKNGSPTVATHPMFQHAAAAEGLAISPDGKLVIYSVASSGKDNTVFVWEPGKSNPRAVHATANRSFQHFAFSQDGHSVVGGINGGLWVWRRESSDDLKWCEQPASFVLEKVRGKLRSVHFVDAADKLGVAVTEFNGALHCHLLDFDRRSSQMILLNDRLIPQSGNAESSNAVISASNPVIAGKHTAIAFANASHRLLFGSDQGRIFSAELRADGSLGPAEELLPQVHQTAVQSIIVHPTDGTLLTTGIDSVVHVWKHVPKRDSWEYDNYLIGTPGNVRWALFGSSADEVLGVDQHGQMLAWNVARQRQRRQLTPLQATGANFSFAAPILSVGPSRDSKSVVTVDSNGVLNRWSLLDGKMLSIGQDQLANYFGHTPGAQFVDMAVNESANLLVTSALLTSQSDRYTDSSTFNAEYCQWSLRSGTMVRRWTRHSKVEPRISLLDSGKMIQYASDDETTIDSVSVPAQQVLRRSDFGTYFAVAHPQDRNWILLVKRTGAVRMLDLRNQSNWDNPGVFQNKLADNADPPMHAAWSPSGKFFYLVFTSGKIARMTWEGSEIGQPIVRNFADQMNMSGIRPQSWRDLDIIVSEESGEEVIFLAARLPGTEPQTKFARLIFANNSSAKFVRHNDLSGRGWLVSRRDRSAPKLLPIARGVQKLLDLDGSSLLATSDCGVYRVSLDKNLQHSVLSRNPVVGATWNANGSRLVTLHEGGALWRADIAEPNRIEWSPVQNGARDATQIRLSPDGQYLVVIREVEGISSAQVLDVTGNQIVRELAHVNNAVWSPSGEMATHDMQGRLHWYASIKSEPIEISQSRQSNSLELCKELRFFGETWNDNRSAASHLLVVRQDSRTDRVELVPVVRPTNAPQPTVSSRIAAAEFPRGSISAVATSPEDSILVIGDVSGTLSVWFSAPGVDGKLHQLFSLEGHRGAKIESLTFTPDGATLISTDSQNRIFGWLSRDSQN